MSIRAPPNLAEFDNGLAPFLRVAIAEAVVFVFTAVIAILFFGLRVQIVNPKTVRQFFESLSALLITK